MGRLLIDTLMASDPSGASRETVEAEEQVRRTLEAIGHAADSRCHGMGAQRLGSTDRCRAPALGWQPGASCLMRTVPCQGKSEVGD
jgi:hypothetical protein